MMKKNIIILYNDFKLRNLSNDIYNLFLENGYKVDIVNSNTANINSNTFILSNMINSDNNNAIEIIYSLNSNDTLAKLLNDNLSKIVDVSKYYQQRSNTNTAIDYYEVLKNVKNNNSIIIKYGQSIINNPNIPLIIYETINEFLKEENVYTVQSGDSLYSIAKKFNTTVDNIKKINNLTSNNLSIGQKLIIPKEESNNNKNSNNNQTIYIVNSGDSLYSIARRFNTTVDNIKKANNLTSNNLSIGQKLIIPSNENNNQTIYTVISGDSLYSIARRFNTTVDNIKKANNLTSNNLSIGQKLIIPSVQNNQTIYTVVSGDSLYSIARRFNTTVDNIKRINNLTSNNLSIGQKLTIT